MTRKLIALVVLLLMVSIVGIVLGCAAPATSTPTPTPTPKVAPGVTPKEVAPGIMPLKIRVAQTYKIFETQGMYIEKFKVLVEERSGGKIKIDHYPAGQLFAQPEQLHAVGLGTVEMIIETNTVLSTVHKPIWDIFKSGERYFKDRKAYNDFWAEPAGGGYFNALLEKDGVKNLGYEFTHTRLPQTIINNRRPIKKLEDFKGLKITGPPGKEWLYETLGFSYIPVPTPERLTAMQTGMVDGGTGSVAAVIATGWDKVTKYATPFVKENVADMTSIYFPMANLGWWNKLNDATKTMLLKALEESQRYALEVAVPQNDKPYWEKIQAAYGANFFNMLKDAPAEAEKIRLLFAEAQGKRSKEVLPPELFNLLETKYRF